MAYYIWGGLSYNQYGSPLFRIRNTCTEIGNSNVSLVVIWQQGYFSLFKFFSCQVCSYMSVCTNIVIEVLMKKEKVDEREKLYCIVNSH